jgi:hypothetical protein
MRAVCVFHSSEYETYECFFKNFCNVASVSTRETKICPCAENLIRNSKQRFEDNNIDSIM